MGTVASFAPRTSHALWRRAAMTGVAVGALNELLYVAGRAAGAHFTVRMGDGVLTVNPLTPFAVSVAAVVAAAAALWTLRGFVWQVLFWTVLVTALGVLSLSGPLALAQDALSKTLLAIMHVGVYVATVSTLRSVALPRRPGREKQRPPELPPRRPSVPPSPPAAA